MISGNEGWYDDFSGPWGQVTVFGRYPETSFAYNCMNVRYDEVITRLHSQESLS